MPGKTKTDSSDADAVSRVKSLAQAKSMIDSCKTKIKEHELSIAHQSLKIASAKTRIKLLKQKWLKKDDKGLGDVKHTGVKKDKVDRKKRKREVKKESSEEESTSECDNVEECILHKD
jgi:hypothetical protein